MHGGEPGAGQGERDARLLARFGYAQELRRALGGFASFALSFSIISVITGVMTAYGAAVGGGGPAALGLGWPLVCAGTMLVALALGELASAFPTAGALYHWSALLGGRGWGWFTAMMNLVGQWAIVAAIDLGCAEALVAAARWPPGATLPALAAIVASHGLINALSVRLVGWLNGLSATVHVVGVVAIAGSLFALGRARPWGFLAETGFTTRADGNYALGFVNGLLLGMWTFTGYDASAHVSEETRDPARRAPLGIVSAVAVSAVAGYALVASLTLAAGDVAEVARADQPALFVLRRALGEGRGDAAMALAVVAMWFCGLSSVTSASRMLFAFARDGGVPFAAALRRVSPARRTPVAAVAASTAVPLALAVATRALGPGAFVAVASLATTGLYVSYGVPIALGVRARARGAWRHRGPFHLGRAGVAVGVAATLWSGFVLVACTLPPNAAAGAMLAGATALVAVLYFAFARARFRGPEVGIGEVEGASPAPPPGGGA